MQCCYCYYFCYCYCIAIFLIGNLGQRTKAVVAITGQYCNCYCYCYCLTIRISTLNEKGVVAITGQYARGGIFNTLNIPPLQQTSRQHHRHHCHHHHHQNYNHHGLPAWTLKLKCWHQRYLQYTSETMCKEWQSLNL